MDNTTPKNYLYNLAYQLLLIVSPVVTLPIASRALGAANLGIFEYTFAISQYFVIVATGGLNIYSQRTVAQASSDPNRVCATFWQLLSLRALSCALAFLIFLVPLLTSSAYRTYYLILSLNIIAAACDISWFFQGRSDFRSILIRGSLVKLSSVGLIVVFIRTPDDLALYIFFQAAPLLAGNSLLWSRLRPLPQRVRIRFRSLLAHARAAALLAVPQVIIPLYTLLPRPLIMALAPTAAQSEVAYFGQADRIIRIVLTAITAMGLVMLSRTAAAFAKGDDARLKTGIYQSFRFAQLTSLPLAAITASAAPTFVPWFFGEGFDKVALLLVILSPAIVLIALSNAIGVQMLIPTGREKLVTLCVTVGCLCGAVVSLSLIPIFGAIGAAVALLVAEGVVTTTEFLVARSEFSLFRALKPAVLYAPAAIFCGLIVYALGSMGRPTIWLTAAQVLVGPLVYCAILCVARDRMFLDSAKKGWGIFRGRYDTRGD